MGIGINNLPASIKDSKILSEKHLCLLSAFNEIPFIEPSFEDDTLQNIFQYYSINPEEMEIELHRYAATLLNEGKVNEAWQVLLALA